MDNIDRLIINTLQDGFPLCTSPYQQIAAQLDIPENELLERLQSLLDNGTLSRFGPMYHAEKMGGALTLAALKAPLDQFDQIAETVNAFPEVAHNYARDHVFNMWFVIATEVPDRIPLVIAEIENSTGRKVYNMPKIREYFVGLKFV